MLTVPTVRKNHENNTDQKSTARVAVMAATPVIFMAKINRFLRVAFCELQELVTAANP